MNKIETASFECPKCGHIFEIDICDKVHKRQPDSNGVLPLTEKELEELTEAEESLFSQISEVRILDNVIMYDAGNYTYTVESIKVFKYLANLFELEVE